ncbi:hypothetical protein HW555_003949 [Spodoptera exigua]|uniref:ISXO2-like transposase domain-containing protein n=1 Tax=Spodoptera exigua TaxID=7107 RepID=A0A835GJD9_SPOEX|nr:hypothetical protein HW555_003949 [Spodoptera exigua]
MPIVVAVAMDPLQVILARYFNIWNFVCAIRDEETAVAAAKAWLLIPARTPRCPICRGNMSREPKLSYKLKYRLRCWRCAREGRPSIRSPLKNTFFERSHVSVLDTVRLMLHFLRKDKVSQAAIDVGKIPPGPFGCLSRLTNKIHVELIPDKSRTTLDPIVEANVRTGTYLMSDMHRAYDNIHLRLGMRGHSSVNHCENFVGGPSIFRLTIRWEYRPQVVMSELKFTLIP